MAYSQLEPFGNDQTLFDMQLASLLAMTANIHRDPKKSKSYKPEDFMVLKQVEEQEPKKRRGPSFADAKAYFGLTGK